jgi:hypothetical protein
MVEMCVKIKISDKMQRKLVIEIICRDRKSKSDWHW